MDYLTFIDQLKPIGWATVAGMFVFFVLKPIIEHIIHKKEGALPPDLEIAL